MSIQFTQDVLSLNDLKTNLGRVVKRVAEVHRPVLLTHQERGAARLGRDAGMVRRTGCARGW